MTAEMEDKYDPIIDEYDLVSDYVIIEVASAHPSAAIIVVENAPGLKAAIADRRETYHPQSLKAWLKQQGFNVLNALPLAIAEEPPYVPSDPFRADARVCPECGQDFVTTLLDDDLICSSCREEARQHSIDAGMAVETTWDGETPLPC